MFLDKFFDEMRVSRAIRTANTYKANVGRFLTYLGKKNIKLEDVQQDDLQKMVVEMVDEKRAPSYVRIVVISILVYNAWLRERGVNVPELRRPKMPRLMNGNPLSVPESVLPAYARVARAIPEPYSTALLLLPVSGLRSFELVELRLSDLKWSPPWMFVTVMGKGKKQRTVPLVQTMNPILKSYLTGWRAGMDESPWLFPNQRFPKSHIHTRALRKHMQRCGEKIGIPLSPHKMRHTYLTLLRRRGITGERLARLAGHSDPNFTEERYVTKDVMDLCVELADVEFPI